MVYGTWSCTAHGKWVALRSQGNFGVCRAEQSPPSPGDVFPSMLWPGRVRAVRGVGHMVGQATTRHHATSCLLSSMLNPAQIAPVITITQ